MSTAADVPPRLLLFNDSVGVFGYISVNGPTGANHHPHRCVCQNNDTTPHKHYRDRAPFKCARCAQCTGYEPAITERTEQLQPSTQGIKYPKLRTRQQITVRYREIEQAKKYLGALLHMMPQPPRFARENIEQQLAACEAQLDALLFALNGVV